jgi:hypothetical protein
LSYIKEIIKIPSTGGYGMLRFECKRTIATALIIAVLAFISAILIGSSSVHTEWVKDGVPICSSLGDQGFTCMIPDGAGGAFIVWNEIRSGVSYDYDVYAQRIDRDGNLLWASDGVPISVESGGQQDPKIIQDGAGGAIIAWRDERSEEYYQVYAQRVDGSGDILWTTNGVPVCPIVTPQYGPLIIPDGQGNYYIAWRDDRHGYGQIYCQKLAGDGNLLWAEEGVRVCPTLNWQDWHRIISDTAGGVILVWHDERYGFLSPYIYAQRLDGSGNLLWGAEGAPIDLFDFRKWTLECVPDGVGGGIVTWYDNGNGPYDIYAQRFNGSGEIQWISRGVAICEAAADQVEPHLVPDDSSGALIAWLDGRDGRDDIYAQRVGSDGVVKWQAGGIMIREGPTKTGSGWGVPNIMEDAVGGAIIAWEQGENTPTSWDIFSQRVDAGGNILWADTAVSVCRAAGGQYYPQITSNGENGAIISWRDLREGSSGKVYAMRVTGNGETVATLLQSFAAHAQGSRMIIEWRLAEIDADARFTVLRSSGGGYEELVDPALQRDGLSFTYSDETCRPGIVYRYRVDIETSGERRVLFESGEISLPSLELALAQNYPNPFNPITTIRFDLPGKERVRLAIYDCAGREIVSLLDGEGEAGAHEVSWDGRDARGAAAGTGIYFYRLTAGKQTLTKKMVLLK